MYMEKLSKYVNELIIIIFKANIITKLQLPKWWTVESFRFFGDLEWTVGLRMHHLFGQDGGQEDFATLHMHKIKI